MGKLFFYFVKFFLDFVDGVLLLQLFVNTFVVGKKDYLWKIGRAHV